MQNIPPPMVFFHSMGDGRSFIRLHKAAGFPNPSAQTVGAFGLQAFGAEPVGQQLVRVSFTNSRSPFATARQARREFINICLHDPQGSSNPCCCPLWQDDAKSSLCPSLTAL